eukprot:scaffold18332_cov37-Tisochrysis_lutea.AAC.2
MSRMLRNAASGKTTCSSPSSVTKSTFPPTLFSPVQEMVARERPSKRQDEQRWDRLDEGAIRGIREHTSLRHDCRAVRLLLPTMSAVTTDLKSTSRV